MTRRMQDTTVISNMLQDRALLWARCLEGDLGVAIARAAKTLVTSLRTGHTIFIFGNGGSAAEAQHFAAELVGRFERDRRALAAIALTTDTSILTAQANDSGYESVFSRQIEGLARRGDVVVGMTTSDISPGHSENIFNGFKAARKKGCRTIGLFSQKTKKLLRHVDVAVIVPDDNTARIQEAHLAVLHIVSKIIEEAL